MTTSDRQSEFLATLTSNAGEDDAAVASRIFAWADSHGLRETYSPPNAHGGAFCPVIPGTATETIPITITDEYAHVFVQGDSFKRRTPFNIPERYDELIERLYAIPQVIQTRDSIYPHIALTGLADPAVWDRFFDVIDWAVLRVKGAVAKGIG